MRSISLLFRVIWLLTILPWAAIADPMVKIGTHPTSPLTSYPRLHCLQAFAGRIYMSYGDWNDYPAVVLASYDPTANQFRLEHSVGSDSVGYFRVIDGKLYASHCDPIHYEDFRDFSYLDPALPSPGWRDQTPIGCYHAFDFAKLGDALYYCGAKDTHEGGIAGAVLMKSIDGGASWTIAQVTPTVDRYYWCFVHGGRVHVRGGRYDGTTFTSGSSLANEGFYKPTNVGFGLTGTEYIVGLASRTPGISAPSSAALVRLDGSTSTSIHTGVFDFVADGKKLYVLTSTNTLRFCNDATEASPTFTNLPITGVPTAPSCLEVLNGVIYVGNATGELWAANLDGAPLVTTLPSTVNLMSEAFGRGLAADGNRLLIGAPDATNLVPLAGRAELFERAFGASWSSTATFAPPLPRVSGWFGKDVAMNGTTVAVVEAGYDTSGLDRGSSARVHVFQRTSAGGWVSRAIKSVPFAHSVAIEKGFLFVGTANPAANQEAGKPGVTTYRLTYTGGGDLVLTGQTQLQPVLNSWGYKPLARVAARGDIVAAGFSGDVSRNGGIGMVSIFKSTGGGTFSSQPFEEISTNASDRFGAAVSIDEKWLAVGAPRNDEAAAQAGAVYLYRFENSYFNDFQKILCPLPQAEANFGAAVALRHGVLLIGSPGVAVNGVRHVGKVYRYVFSGATWIPDGEVPKPAASVGEYGIEVAIGDTYLAGGSRFVTNAATLEERVGLQTNPRPFTGLDLWAEQAGLGTASPLDDGDDDDLPQVFEYVFHLNPGASDSTIEAIGLPLVQGRPALQPVLGGGFEFRYVVPSSDSRLTAQVERSGDLTEWTPVVTAPTVIASSGGWELRAVAIPADGSQVFVRLKVLYDRT